jgi:hypothetical protein
MVRQPVVMIPLQLSGGHLPHHLGPGYYPMFGR